MVSELEGGSQEQIDNQIEKENEKPYKDNEKPVPDGPLEVESDN